jgi:predicted DNA-binding transcriptional regulator AlpA
MDIPEEEAIQELANRLWANMIGEHASPVEFNLLAKLALEQRLLGRDTPSFGLDKLSSNETAAYVGVQVATLHDRQKRRALGIPEPYPIGRKLFWRRSELDVWIEGQRESGKAANPYEPLPSLRTRGNVA